MTALPILSTSAPEDSLIPASPGGDEFTAPPGAVVLVAANDLRSRDRVITLRVAREGGTDEIDISIGRRQTSVIGPFGMAYGLDGFGIPSAEPVTVTLSYPRVRGLRIGAFRLPDARASLDSSAP